jgi:hypothetical protein
MDIQACTSRRSWDAHDVAHEKIIEHAVNHRRNEFEYTNEGLRSTSISSFSRIRGRLVADYAGSGLTVDNHPCTIDGPNGDGKALFPPSICGAA